MDIKQAILDQLSGAATEKIAAKNGVSPKTADSTVQNAVDALLSGLQHNVQNGGADALNTALAKKHDGSILADITGAVANGSVAKDGNNILGHIFGGQTGAVAKHVGKASGVDSSVASSVLSALAPIVLGQLGQAKQSGGLDAGGIAQEVLRQKTRGSSGSGVGGIITGLLDQNKDGSVVDDVIRMGTNLFRKK